MLGSDKPFSFLSELVQDSLICLWPVANKKPSKSSVVFFSQNQVMDTNRRLQMESKKVSRGLLFEKPSRLPLEIVLVLTPGVLGHGGGGTSSPHLWLPTQAFPLGEVVSCGGIFCLPTSPGLYFSYTRKKKRRCCEQKLTFLCSSCTVELSGVLLSSVGLDRVV